MFDRSRDSLWTSRRNPQVQKPIADLGGSASGIPYLSPDILLFYKAAAPREKDELDFAHLQPVLTPAHREWLVAAITKTYGGDHRWLWRLTTAPA